MTSRVGDYLLRETLGTGAFGRVRRAVHQTTAKHYAIKIMNKALIRNQELTLNVRREIVIMKAFSHPNIVSVHDVLTSRTKLYVVLDLVRGPELFEVIAKRGPGGLPEKEARRYFQNLIDGVDYCHRRGVCHRDLKPENLLVDHDGILKITDFGLSSMKGANTTTDLLTTQCGTPNYIAPEIISCLNPVYDGQKVDAWACGIILYALLAGYLPFDETDLAQLFEVIQKGHVEFPHWFSAGARDLIGRLLCVDPHTRASVQDVKQHPWFLVSYQASPRSGAPAARRRRRRSRASKSLDEMGIDRLSAQAPTQQQPTLNLPETVPLPPIPSMELPSLHLPVLQQPVANEGNRNTSVTAAAAAETARMEMLRSHRAISFSKKYSLLRKGTINYGGLEIGVGSFHGPTTLGGEHQARLRGVLSACNSSFSLPQHGADITNASKSDAERALESQESTNLNKDDVSEQQDTMHAIQSLRNVISASRAMLQAAEEINSNCGAEDHEIRESTLKALRKLRDELQTTESRFSKHKEGKNPGCRSHCTTFMSRSQRKDTIRLLDVWESRILSDLRSDKGSEDTRVTEQEIFAFQSLLQTWETHLGGEDYVEDVLIPGSETVDDESPATIVPERFLDTRNFLRHIECRRKGRDGEPFGTHDNHCDTLPSSQIPSITEGTNTSLRMSQRMPGANKNVDVITSSSQKGGDLTKLWNHVLIANTSKLDDPQDESGCAYQGVGGVANFFAEEVSSSPVMNCHPSPYSSEGSELVVGDTQKGGDRSRSQSRSSEMVTPNSIETYRRSPSPQKSPKTSRQSEFMQESSHAEDTGEDLQVLKSIKSHDFVTEPPLVRSHAQRHIGIDSLPPHEQLKPLSSGNCGEGSQPGNDNRSESPRAKSERLKRGDLRTQHIDSLLGVARKHNFLHIRSKYSAQFESGYDPRICLRELGRLMKNEGIDVSRKHGHKTLRVRLPGPRKNRELTASFDFHARGRMGCVVHFKRTSGDRSLSRSEEEKVLSNFLRKTLVQFSDSEPGLAVLPDSRQ